MKKMRKFVIQEHTESGCVHWDLMLERGEGPSEGTGAGESFLETYRVEVPPDKLGLEVNGAQKIFDHSSKFLTYEGSVKGGTGNVTIAERGTYQLLEERADYRRVRLQGQNLKGCYCLNHIEGSRWEIRKL
jgi:hypothetical protein